MAVGTVALARKNASPAATRSRRISPRLNRTPHIIRNAGSSPPPSHPAPGAFATKYRTRGCPVRAGTCGRSQHVNQANRTGSGENPLRAQFGLANLSGAPPGLKIVAPDPAGTGSSAKTAHLAGGHIPDTTNVRPRQRRPILSLSQGVPTDLISAETARWQGMLLAEVATWRARRRLAGTRAA